MSGPVGGEITRTLEEKTRDDLDIIARELQIRKYRRLTTPELIARIAKTDEVTLRRHLKITWWDKHQTHVYAIGSLVALGLILALVFFAFRTGEAERLLVDVDTPRAPPQVERDARQPRSRKAVRGDRVVPDSADKPTPRNHLAHSRDGQEATPSDQGNLSGTTEDYDKAVERYTRLVEQEERPEFRIQLAMSHSDRAIAQSDQGRLNRAIKDHDKAIEVYTQLVEQDGRTELRNDLAASHNNRGIAYRNQDRYDEAIEDYSQAIEIYTPLVQQEGRTDLRHDLAASLHNRAIALTMQGELDLAIQDIDQATELLTQLFEHEGQTEFADELADAIELHSLILEMEEQAGD